MASVNINGAALAYIEHGKGEPLVLVHGSASDYRTWQLPQSAFAERWRTIVYSRRYHWPNEEIPAGTDYFMQQQVDDLQTLVQTLSVAPTHLIGHSYGAFLCLLLAIQAPHLVRSLILAEPPVVSLFVSNRPKPRELLALLISWPRTAIAIIKFGANGASPAGAAARRGDMAKAMRVFGTAVLGREFYQRLSESRLEQLRANAIRAEFLGSGFAPLAADDVRAVQIPVLLLTGQRSPRLFHRLTDRLEQLLPDTERIEIDGASHILHEDNPAAYIDAVLSFLIKHS